MVKITDESIWSKLDLKDQIKWLQIEADMQEQKCISCYEWVCICGEDF
jgi:hypothetical protein